jgi:fructokinase
MLKERVEKQGIDTTGLFLDSDVHTTLAFVNKLPNGDRDFSFYRKPGADMMLSAADVDRVKDLLEDTKVFHFGTLSMTDEPAAEATKLAISIAKKNGALISFDPNYIAPLWESEEKALDAMKYGFEQCDILKISDDEVTFFTGEEDVLEGAKKIKEKYGIKLVCATLGKDGSYALYGDHVVKCNPFLNPNTIETTGAGDTFMGSVLNAVLEVGIENYSEDSLREMLTTANAAASLITTKRGALKVMPTVDEIKDYMKEA